jgi:hypothetical protein
MKTWYNNRGMTLAEVLIAATVLGFGVYYTAAYFSQTSRAFAATQGLDAILQYEETFRATNEQTARNLIRGLFAKEHYDSAANLYNIYCPIPAHNFTQVPGHLGEVTEAQVSGCLENITGSGVQFIPVKTGDTNPYLPTEAHYSEFADCLNPTVQGASATNLKTKDRLFYCLNIKPAAGQTASQQYHSLLGMQPAFAKVVWFIDYIVPNPTVAGSPGITNFQTLADILANVSVAPPPYNPANLLPGQPTPAAPLVYNLYFTFYWKISVPNGAMYPRYAGHYFIGN